MELLLKNNVNLTKLLFVVPLNNRKILIYFIVMIVLLLHVRGNINTNDNNVFYYWRNNGSINNNYGNRLKKCTSFAVVTLIVNGFTV